MARHLVYLCLVFIITFQSPSRAWIHGAPAMVWSQVKLGGGGFVTGGTFCQSGIGVARTDVGGAYIRKNASDTWHQILLASNTGVIVNNTNGQGFFAVGCSNANGWTVFGVYLNVVYKLSSGGAWQSTGFPNFTSADSNGSFKLGGQRIAIDPANSNVVYVGTNNTSGLQVSFDGGVTAAQVVSITAASSSSPGITGIQFDSSGGTGTCPGGASPCTNNIFVASYGNGVWKSTDAGNTWTKIADGSSGLSPVNVWNAKIAPDGGYWVTDHANVWQCAATGCDTTGSGWSKYTTLNSCGGSGYVAALQPLPTVGSVMFFQSSNCFKMTLTNNGTTLKATSGCDTWSPAGFICGAISTFSSSTIPWLTITVSGGNPVISDVAYDSANSQVCAFNGDGIYCLAPPTGTVPCGGNQCLPTVAVSAETTGIEELVGNDMMSPPGGVPIFAGWDRQAFYLNDQTVYPSTTVPNTSFSAAWQLDYASSDPSIVCVRSYFPISSPFEFSGCSNSYGAPGTWTLFGRTGLSLGQGGGIAVADANNVVMEIGTVDKLQCTTNAGASAVWANCTGAPTSGWGSQQRQNAVVCADRVTVGTFYAVNYTGTTDDIWSVTGGAGGTWSKVFSGTISDGHNSSQTQLRCAPGHAGHLWFANNEHTNTPGLGVMARSTDGGVTWTQIKAANGYCGTVSSLSEFGFGAAAPGATYPTIWFRGYVNGVRSLYRSTDGMVTCPAVTPNYPDSQDYIQSVSGDMNDSTIVYFTMGGTGAWKGELNYLLNRDLHHDNDNSPAFLSHAA